MEGSDPPMESEKRCSVIRYSMIWPGSEMELGQLEQFIF